MPTEPFVNPFELPGKWYKANLHAHTTTSDGQLSPADRVVQYRRAGYNVLALTDHLRTNDLTGLPNEQMLVISGMEYHPPCPTSQLVCYHLVALNIAHGFEFDDPDDANRCIRQVRSAGGETFLAHPYWSGQEYRDFENLRGLIAMEVYNAACNRPGRATSENEWAYALDRGNRLPAVGVDDAHSADGEDVFGCWTLLKMNSLTVENVIQAVKTGACYVTCGPEITDFRLAEGMVRVTCSPAAKIHLLGGPGGRGARRVAEKGKTITSFEIEVPDWPYLRAVVTDADGQKAWTNPIIL